MMMHTLINLRQLFHSYLNKMGADDQNGEDRKEPAPEERQKEPASSVAQQQAASSVQQIASNQISRPQLYAGPRELHFLFDPYWYDSSKQYEEAARQWIRGLIQQPDRRARYIYRYAVSPFEKIDVDVPPPLVVHPYSAWQAYQKYRQEHANVPPDQLTHRFVDFLFPTYDIRRPPIMATPQHQ